MRVREELKHGGCAAAESSSAMLGLEAAARRCRRVVGCGLGQGTACDVIWRSPHEIEKETAIRD